MPLYEVFESFPTWCILKVFKIKCLAEQPVAYFFTQSSVLPQLLIAFNFDFLTILLGIRRMSPVYTWMIIVSECPERHPYLYNSYILYGCESTERASTMQCIDMALYNNIRLNKTRW